MEYHDLMKQAEDFNKKLHRTKDINVNDYLTVADRVSIAKIIDTRMKNEFQIDDNFVWTFNCKGHFDINR